MMRTKNFPVVSSFIFGVLMLFVMFNICVAESAVISKVAGNVQVYSPHSDMWYDAGSNLVINEGQRIRTSGNRARATVHLADDSKVEVGPNSNVSFDSLSKESPKIKIGLGRLKAWVSKIKRNKFEVHTPIAVCSVRGTEFDVAVGEKGETEIEVIEGEVAVCKHEDLLKEVMVGAGERLEVRENTPLSPSDKSESITGENFVRNEVGLGMSKEQVQSAAAQEMRLAEYMEGKTLIDVFGKRVRLDEYIIRPAADTFKLVVLNERSDRFDYFYYKGKFNKDLPQDMSIALADLSGKAQTMPDYYLTEFETGRSNTLDTIKENGSGGHLVDVNSNADPADDISYYYDAGLDKFLSLDAGTPYYKTVFDNYEYFINGNKKMWYSASNLQSENLASWKYAGDIMQSKTEYPLGQNYLCERISNFYGNGTWESWENYIISDEGKVASLSSFDGITTGKGYKEELLKWNYEQVVTASEFGGRKIDLVVEPKILIKSGIIK